MPEVRPATPADVDAIARLAARTFALACPDHTPPEAIAAHIATELTADRFREHMARAQFLVVDGPPGEVSGYVMLTRDPPPIETTWADPLELRRIYVDEAEHGKGTASALMQASVAVAERDGHDWLWLGTNEQNQRAIRFYEKFGFTIVGRRTFFVADSEESDHVMARYVGAA
ncbi:MAG: GNAT family N-acetyltransferase [Actinobacteria bacterium]|nr:GNAT family N-acetyltransferase [Actinomycetota bacterium]HPJ20079.1 GNAT family N-acetyltransferase [Actinomycetota bacterium]